MIGTKILDKVSSPYNGNITIVKTFGSTRILVDGIAQSGSLVRKIWKKALDTIRSLKPEVEVKDILILGLGGGSVLEIIEKYWPNSQKTGVEIDQLMVDIGKKYLNLDHVRNLNTVVENAFEWVKSHKGKRKFDLILVDLCIGGNVPKEFITKDFLIDLKALLKDKGIAAFNHLYFGDKKEEAANFETKLGSVFSSKIAVKPNSNIIFICY